MFFCIFVDKSLEGYFSGDTCNGDGEENINDKKSSYAAIRNLVNKNRYFFFIVSE